MIQFCDSNKFVHDRDNTVGVFFKFFSALPRLWRIYQSFSTVQQVRVSLQITPVRTKFRTAAYCIISFLYFILYCVISYILKSS